VFIKTVHTLRMTLVVLEDMRSGAFSREPVDVCIESFINSWCWLLFCN